MNPTRMTRATMMPNGSTRSNPSITCSGNGLFYELRSAFMF